jgi:hypothetical protein
VLQKPKGLTEEPNGVFLALPRGFPFVHKGAANRSCQMWSVALQFFKNAEQPLPPSDIAEEFIRNG